MALSKMYQPLVSDSKMYSPHPGPVIYTKTLMTLMSLISPLTEVPWPAAERRLDPRDGFVERRGSQIGCMGPKGKCMHLDIQT